MACRARWRSTAPRCADDLGIAGRRVVTFFGRATTDCGLRESVEAMFLLQARYPDLLFLIVSPQWVPNWYLEACRERVERIGSSRSILFFDRPMSEALKLSLLGVAEVVLIPTMQTWGVPPATLRLPLAAGRATIAPHWLLPDGAEDAVRDLSSAAPQRIARAIDDLLGDSARRAVCEAAARRVAREQSWERVAAELLTALGVNSIAP